MSSDIIKGLHPALITFKKNLWDRMDIVLKIRGQNPSSKQIDLFKKHWGGWNGGQPSGLGSAIAATAREHKEVGRLLEIYRRIDVAAQRIIDICQEDNDDVSLDDIRDFERGLEEMIALSSEF